MLNKLRNKKYRCEVVEHYEIIDLEVPSNYKPRDSEIIIIDLNAIGGKI